MTIAIERRDFIRRTECFVCNQPVSYTHLDVYKRQIPDSVTSLGDGCFGECSALTTINFPKNLNEIAYQTFFNCKSLTSCLLSTSQREHVEREYHQYENQFLEIKEELTEQIYRWARDTKLLKVCLLYTSYLKLGNIKGNSNFRWVLISCTIELFISMALTYYTLYTINSNWFEINGILLNSVEQKLFEFAYLAFSIVTTYSSVIISLTGVVPRIFQIIHTVIVLTVLAKTLKLIFSEE